MKTIDRAPSCPDVPIPHRLFVWGTAGVWWPIGSGRFSGGMVDEGDRVTLSRSGSWIWTVQGSVTPVTVSVRSHSAIAQNDAAVSGVLGQFRASAINGASK